MTPSPEVLDLFAVPDDVEPLDGGQGRSVRAGDLVLSPDRDPGDATWLNPVLARLSVRLDEAPGRQRQDLRVALPVPARDGSWVVDGWGATRYEPGSATCDDLDVTLAAGRVFHAQLASAVPTRPAELDRRTGRYADAERRAFAEPTGLDLGPDQLVHGDLAGNVLIDAHGAPVVIDVAPYWRPVLWAEAVAVLDMVTWSGTPRERIAAWTRGARREAMLCAITFRTLSDEGPDGTYDDVLALLSAT